MSKIFGYAFKEKNKNILENYQGEQVIVPRLVVPKHAPQNGVAAQNASFKGGLKSRMQIDGKLDVVNTLDIEAEALAVKQQVVTRIEEAKFNRRCQRPTQVDKAQPNTGLVKARKIKLQIAELYQTGGSIEAGAGGASITAINIITRPLRTTTVINSNCDSSIRPDFTPAKISSTGGLNLTAQNINGSSLHLHADQVLELSYQILEVLLTTEYYNLPVHKKKFLFSTKVSGGAVPSTKGNIFHGGQGVILNSNGRTHLQNVVFTGRRPVYNLDQSQLLIETLNPESHLYSYRKMTLIGHAAIIAASYFTAGATSAALGLAATATTTVMVEAAIRAAVSAALYRGNILKSVIQSTALAGFGNITSTALAAQRYGTMLNAAVQASASHIITGSHFGHNLFANVISGSAGVGASPELTSMQRIINGVVSDVILSAVSKRSLEDTIKSGILNAVGTIAAQHGEAMGTRITQRQAKVTAYKSAPAAAQAATPTRTKARAKLAPAETSMFQVEPLTSTTPSTSLTNTISSAIDRDLGYLVNPKQVSTNAIATSTTVHRRVLGNNSTNTHSVNAVYGRDSNQALIYQANFQAPYGLQVQEMGRMHGGGIAAGYNNISTFTMGQSNVPRQTSFVGRAVNGLVNLVPAAYASEGNYEMPVLQSERNERSFYNRFYDMNNSSAMHHIVAFGRGLESALGEGLNFAITAAYVANGGFKTNSNIEPVRSSNSYLPKFSVGLASGAAVAELSFIASQAPVIGAVITTAGAVGAIVMVGSMAETFEQNNFMYTEDYEHIMQNNFLSDSQKNAVRDNAFARQAAARADAANTKSILTKIKENPFETGFFVGSALGVGVAKPLYNEGRVIYNVYNLEKIARVPHVFAKVNGSTKHGHLPDTFQNRRMIVKTMLNEKNFLGVDNRGNKWYAKNQANGKQSWARVSNKGVLKSGGLNEVPIDFHPEYGLCKPPKLK